MFKHRKNSKGDQGAGLPEGGCLRGVRKGWVSKKLFCHETIMPKQTIQRKTRFDYHSATEARKRPELLPDNQDMQEITSIV
jgi:hypothetical protein